jgi:hypothetical protein
LFRVFDIFRGGTAGAERSRRHIFKGKKADSEGLSPVPETAFRKENSFGFNGLNIN